MTTRIILIFSIHFLSTFFSYATEEKSIGILTQINSVGLEQEKEYQNTKAIKSLKDAEKKFETNNNITEGIETFLNLGQYYLSQQNTDSALLYTDKSFHLAKLVNDLFYVARANLQFGNIYGKSGKINEAIESITLSKDYFSNTNNLFWLHQANASLANYWVLQGDILSGEKTFKEIITEAELPENSKAVAISYLGMGNIFMQKNNPSEAFKNYTQAYNLWKNLNNPSEMAWTLLYISEIYSEVGLDSLALKTIGSALTLNKNNTNSFLSKAHQNNAIAFFNLNELEKALSEIELAIQLNSETANLPSMYLCQLVKADILQKRKDYFNARDLIEQVLPIIKETNKIRDILYGSEIYAQILHNLGETDRASMIIANNLTLAQSVNNINHIQINSYLLGKMMNERGQFISASRFLMMSTQYTDSVNKSKDNKQLKDAIIKHEISKEETSYSDKIKIQQKSDATQLKRLLILIIPVLAIVLVFAILFFIGLRTNKKLYNNLKISNQVILDKNIKLENLMKFNGKIFTSLSHDLRSPITSMSHSIELLKHDDFEEDKKSRILDLSKEQVDATLHMLDNLLRWARGQSESITPHKEAVNICEAIEQIRKPFNASLERKKITLKTSCDKDSVAFADRQLFKLVLINLLSNALKFTPRNGEISISVVSTNGHHTITVEDNGVGISESDQMKILNPDTYFRSKGTENERGSGIGLKLCRQYVKLMEGDLSIESFPGKGSKFIFTAPSHS